VPRWAFGPRVEKRVRVAFTRFACRCWNASHEEPEPGGDASLRRRLAPARFRLTRSEGPIRFLMSPEVGEQAVEALAEAAAVAPAEGQAAVAAAGGPVAVEAVAAAEAEEAPVAAGGRGAVEAEAAAEAEEAPVAAGGRGAVEAEAAAEGEAPGR
jgi:hypothetical protein